MQNPTTSTTTCGAQPSESQTRPRRFLLPREISTDAAFQFRHMGIDKAHVKGLAQTLRTVGDLEPILVWQEVRADGQVTGRLVLLDGQHRLAAYATAKGSQEAVPVTILTGGQQVAMLAAVRANTRDSLPLTKTERVDAAWRLVRLPGKRLTVLAIAKAAGVGSTTVDRMRKRWAVMLAQTKEATGEWWRDQHDEIPARKERPEMSDEERRAAIGQIAERIREAIGKLPWQDEHLAAEALECALGVHKLRSMAEYLYADEEDEFAEDQTGTFAGTVKVAETAVECRDF